MRSSISLLMNIVLGIIGAAVASHKVLRRDRLPRRRVPRRLHTDSHRARVQRAISLGRLKREGGAPQSRALNSIDETNDAIARDDNRSHFSRVNGDHVHRRLSADAPARPAFVA